MVKWHSNSPSMKEITALRKLCPELKGISAGDFFYMVKRTLPWELGEFYKWKALELIEAGAKYGLDLGIEELSKEPNPRYRSK